MRRDLLTFLAGVRRPFTAWRWRAVASAALMALATCSIVVVLALALVPRLSGWRPVVVTGGSMEPALATGSLALTRPATPGDLEPGDIVVFHDLVDGSLVSHRLERRTAEGQLITRGDANRYPDAAPLSAERVEGVVVFSVPLVGYALAWATSGMGRVLLLVVPASLLAALEGWTLLQAVRRRHRGEAEPAVAPGSRDILLDARRWKGVRPAGGRG